MCLYFVISKTAFMEMHLSLFASFASDFTTMMVRLVHLTTCFSHSDGGVQFRVFGKKQFVGFSPLFLSRLASIRETAVDTIFKNYDSVMTLISNLLTWRRKL